MKLKKTLFIFMISPFAMAATVVSPVPDQVLTVNQNTTDVFFSWKDVPQPGISKLKIVKSKDKKIKIFETKKTNLRVKLQASEDYVWSVYHSGQSLPTNGHKLSIKQFTKHFSFNLGLVNREISARNNSTHSKGTLGTRQGQMLRISWVNQKNKFSYGGVYGLDKLSFEDPANRKLKKQDFLLSSFGLIGEYRLSPAISIYDYLTYGQELYYFGVDDTFVRLNQGNAFSNRLGLQWMHHFTRNIDMGLRAGLTSLLPTTTNGYTSQTGHGFHSQLSMMSPGLNRTYSGTIEYMTQNQNTSTFDQDHTSVRFSLGIIYPLHSL